VTQSGDRFYLGASISYADQKIALPALALDREPLLEYDLTRAVARAATTAKPVVGVMSALPVFGMPPSQFTGGQPMEPQVFIGELRRDYTVKRVSLDPDRIDDDVKVLLVVHPRGISDKAQYALDQFRARGGKLIAFLDPSAYFDQLGQMGGMGGGGTPSSLDKLLKAWGLAFDSGKVVLDMRYLTGAGRARCRRCCRSTTTLSRRTTSPPPGSGPCSCLSRGCLPANPRGPERNGPDQDFVVLPARRFLRGHRARRGGVKTFQPSGTEYPLAVRLTGKFKTAFPDGKPRPEDKTKAGPAKDAAPLKESAAENAVVLVGDSDFINDGAAVQIRRSSASGS